GVARGGGVALAAALRVRDLLVAVERVQAQPVVGRVVAVERDGVVGRVEEAVGRVLVVVLGPPPGDAEAGLAGGRELRGGRVAAGVPRRLVVAQVAQRARAAQARVGGREGRVLV